MDKSAREAMELFAMLNGGTPVVPDEDAILDEAIRNEKGKVTSKKKASSNAKKEVTNTKPVDTGLLPNCDFAKLDDKGHMTVLFREHDIKYKEQHWPVPDRTVKYDIVLVKTAHEARRISDILSNNSQEERDKASKGLVRYYKVVAAENVNNDVTTIAYVKVLKVKGSPSFMIMTNTGVLKKYNACIDDVNYELKKKMSKLIKRIKVSA